MSPLDVVVGESATLVAEFRHRHDDAAVVCGDDLAFDPPLTLHARLGPNRDFLAYETLKVLGSAEPTFQPRASYLELVAAGWADLLLIDGRRDRPARRGESVQVDPAFSVDRHDDVAGTELDIDQLQASGAQHRRGDALYVV